MAFSNQKIDYSLLNDDEDPKSDNDSEPEMFDNVQERSHHAAPMVVSDSDATPVKPVKKRKLADGPKRKIVDSDSDDSTPKKKVSLADCLN